MLAVAHRPTPPVVGVMRVLLEQAVPISHSPLEKMTSASILAASSRQASPAMMQKLWPKAGQAQQSRCCQSWCCQHPYKNGWDHRGCTRKHTLSQILADSICREQCNAYQSLPIRLD